MNYIEKEEEKEIDFFNDNENSDEKYKLLRNGEESLINEKDDKDNSNDLIDFLYNKKLNNSLNSKTTIYLNNSRDEDFNISFFPKNNNEENNNFKNKKFSKESIEILNNFILKELLITSQDKLENKLNNKIYNDIKEIRNNLISLDNEMFSFFRKPFMRKNESKVGIVNEEEKNKYNEKKEIINFISNNIKNCV